MIGRVRLQKDSAKIKSHQGRPEKRRKTRFSEGNRKQNPAKKKQKKNEKTKSRPEKTEARRKNKRKGRA